ncbi:MAG: asparaginase [Selenomonadales bacterium]|jgi:L-asparaginase|nr:asparaginase [Selenomonadales bacterium]
MIPHIMVLATGGTIAGRGDSPLQTMGYRAGQFTVDEMLDDLPDITSSVRVSGEQFVNLPSSALTPTDWLKLAQRVNALLSENDIDGIVITHGTDTMEETAFFLHLVVQSKKPVVLVGAMRPATALSPDGPMNLVNAIRVAAANGSKGLGVLVVMNDEIFSARDVTKTSTTRLDAFRSPDFGALGSIDNGQVGIYRRPLRKHTLDAVFRVGGLAKLPRVDIVLGYVGADDVLVKAVLKAGAQGIVLAGTGAGHISPSADRSLQTAMERGTIIVRSSRTGGGRILPASLDDFIACDNLSPQKARILLMLALTITRDAAEIQRMFGEY